MSAAHSQESARARGVRNELVRAITISDSIRVIAETAAQVSRVAVNATVLAKRTGSLASGFGVLSNELHRFTKNVNLAMDELRGHAFEMVSEVSVLLRHVHLHAILQRTADDLKVNGAEAWMQRVLTRYGSAQDKRLQVLAKLQKKLKSSLDEAQKTGLFGTVLARTGLIEASYAGSGTGELRAVAVEFEKTIGEIVQSLDRLKSVVQHSKLRT